MFPSWLVYSKEITYMLDAYLRRRLTLLKAKYFTKFLKSFTTLTNRNRFATNRRVINAWHDWPSWHILILTDCLSPPVTQLDRAYAWNLELIKKLFPLRTGHAWSMTLHISFHKNHVPASRHGCRFTLFRRKICCHKLQCKSNLILSQIPE